MDYVYVGLGGLLGSNMRYWVGGWAAARFGTTFPYGTFLINVTGSLLLGFITSYLALRTYSPNWRLFFAVGFCGGYTTFSTYTYESIRLLEQGNVLLALLYFVGGPMLGLAAAFAGLVAGRSL
jgi:CrcB protein